MVKRNCVYDVHKMHTLTWTLCECGYSRVELRCNKCGDTQKDQLITSSQNYLFDNVLSTYTIQASNGRITVGQRIGKDLEGSDRGLIEVTCSYFAWGDWGKPRKTSFRVTSVRAKIRSVPLPKRSPERYRYAILLDEKLLVHRTQLHISLYDKLHYSTVWE
jgi:hypothetical protein